MIEQFINCYSLSKTLRFSLIPVGKTEEYFNHYVLETDLQRSENYKSIKTVIDRYHKEFIESVLKNFVLEGVEEYATSYYKHEELINKEKKMRDAIKKAFEGDQRHKLLSIGKSDFIKKELPQYTSNDEECKAVESFCDFCTYLTGFFENRRNMYGVENGSIAYRCINDNLPKFIDNVKSFEKVKVILPEENLKKLSEDFPSVNVEDVFALENFSNVLAQSGITQYNNFIGGYSNSDGSKICGLNEYINLYNQKVDKTERLPLMKQLFKQILSDRESISYIPEEFKSDNELLRAINHFYCDEDIREVIEKLIEIIQKIDSYDLEGIYIATGTNITDLSKTLFNDWSIIKTNWEAEYDATHKIGKDVEKYEDKREKEYKRIKSFSIYQLQSLGNNEGSICEYFKNTSLFLQNSIEKSYAAVRSLLTSEYTSNKKLAKNDDAITLVKEFLDSIKDFEKLIKMLLGTGKEAHKDNAFYGEFLDSYERLKAIDGLYNKVRNYLTKKPYSTDKFKINFDNSSFLSGWATDYTTKAALLIAKENEFYIAIVDKKLDENSIKYISANPEENLAQRIVYDFHKLDNKEVPRILIKSKGKNYAPVVRKYNLPVEDIIEIYDNDWFKKEYAEKDPIKFKDSLTKIIDYFKIGLKSHDSCKHYNFKWKESSEYDNISDFYRDVENSCYQLGKEDVNFSHLVDLANEGKIYLFQIYNKDFSKFSKGKPNLHTLYFKMLFDERNLKNIVYKLSGGAEMFYRKPSLKRSETTIHNAHEPLVNKNPDNAKKQSIFDYELVKDKRFTKRQFSLHIPIMLNFQASDSKSVNMNKDVREVLKGTNKHHVIGIDRGERNLVYVSVIDETGKIRMQKSFNIIESDNHYKVNYNSLLDARADTNNMARKSWKTIENIKDLKEGYVSQVVHEICKLVVEYDAIIALEALSDKGFINSRKKVEKQVYQKFEDMLVHKLQYLTDKSTDIEAPGGLLNAYQLTENPENHKSIVQNGIVFYVPAWLTSKIDPVTGFVDLLKPRYKSVASAKDLIEKFDDIRYNNEENIFEFLLDYKKFPKTNADYQKIWTVCTNGERIKTFRNKEKNNNWDNKTVILTDEFKDLFCKFNIDYSRDDLKEQILQQNEKEFFERFLKNLSLTLQMRNSITGNQDIDYIISPVKNSEGVFFDSRNYEKWDALPCDADANGAYNIARKALWAINQLKQSEDVNKAKLSITKKEWLEYAQKR